jgi:hypothetical protein
MIVSGLDVIARSADFESAAARYELRPWQWRFLHALDGRAELRDVAVACGIELADALGFVDESEAAGLACVVAMSHDEYCNWSGAPAPADSTPVAQAQTAVAEPAYADMSTRGDHFSTSDGMAAYETPVPAWMVAPSTAEPEPVAAHDEGGPVAEYHHEDPVAEYHHEEPVAEYQHEEPVAEHQHDEPVAEYQHEEPVAEYQHEEPVAQYQHEEPVAQYHYEVAGAGDYHGEPIAQDQHEEPVAEYQHEEPVAEYQHEEPVAEYQHEEPVAHYHYEVAGVDDHHEEPVPQDQHEAPEADYHHEEPAEEHPAEPSTVQAEPEMTAAQAVADLVGQHSEAGAPAHDEPVRNGVSLSFGGPDHSAFSPNGYHHEPSWEPATLVTSVDDQPEHAATADDAMPAGVSISLSSSSASPAQAESEPAAYAYPMEEPKGRVSFSLSPEDFAPAYAQTPITHEDTPTATHDDTPGATHDDTPVATHDDTPVATLDDTPVAMHDDTPVATHDDTPVAMHDDTPVAMHEESPIATHDDAPVTNGHVENTPVVRPGPVASSMTADIVGNLIARALTFRIK